MDDGEAHNQLGAKRAQVLILLLDTLRVHYTYIYNNGTLCTQGVGVLGPYTRQITSPEGGSPRGSDQGWAGGSEVFCLGERTSHPRTPGCVQSQP